MTSPSSCPLELIITLLMCDDHVEVVQQSKARRKDDFWMAFSPVIAEATATAYKGASYDVQQKLRRVVEVWRQRNIFEGPIQDAIEARIDGKPYNSIPIILY
jgi:regulator of Ty1 transposition protein 103